MNRRSTVRGRRAMQMDDTGYGGIVTTNEPDEPPTECADMDGDGDCDVHPEHDTDHDYWAEDGTQLQPLPGKPLIPQDQGTMVSASLRRPRQHRHDQDDCEGCPEH